MKAELLIRERIVLGSDEFVELVVHRLPKALFGSTHAFKYRLALVRNGVCVMRFDNEAGKGDHKHLGEREVPYRFTSLEKLQADFWSEVERLRK